MNNLENSFTRISRRTLQSKIRSSKPKIRSLVPLETSQKQEEREKEIRKKEKVIRPKEKETRLEENMPNQATCSTPSSLGSPKRAFSLAPPRLSTLPKMELSQRTPGAKSNKVLALSSM